MINVPAGVWIDEEGNIVRPAETAYSKGARVMGQKIGDDRYAQGLRDWVKNGKKSKWVLSKDKLKKRLALKSPKKQQAAAQFRLGVYFHKKNDKVQAQKHWVAAQKLYPENWNYHRQAWSYQGAGGQMKWFQKVQKLAGKPYYEPLDVPKEGDKKEAEKKDRPKTGAKKKRRF